jgi:holo-[acyl-carrier protein] synthase
MNIIGHGIDLVDCRRIEQMLQQHAQRFLDRVFTPAEQRYCRRHRFSVERFAGHFAVKEAVMKVLGTGWKNGIAWTDIETLHLPGGKPQVRLAGKVAQIAAQLGVEQVSVSITHTSDLAIASAIALGAAKP